MEFDFNKINKFLNDEEIKINKTIRSSKNNNVDSQINTTITPLNTKVDFNKIKQEQNSILSTPYQPTTKIVKQSEKSIETDYQKLFDNSSNKFNNAVLEEANKNTIQLANSGSKGIDISNIFKTPENFKDGYQFGDVTKTALSTAGDVVSSGVEGILRFGEGLGDLAQYGVAGVADLFGADNFADSVRKNAQQDAISQLYDMTGIDKLNDNSVAGSTTNTIAQGVGNVIAMSNAGALLPKGMQTIGTKNFKLPTASIVSGMGSGMTEAYNNGATDGEAFIYGLGSGLVEGFSESLFSGLGSKFSKIYGGGALDDVAIKSLTNKISNKTLKVLSESGLKALGEGTEEVISGYGNAIMKKLTYLSDEDFKKIVEDENLLEQFIIGTLTSAVMQAPSTITSVKNGTDYIPDEINQNSSKTTTNLNRNIQNSINTLTNEINVENGLNYAKNAALKGRTLPTYKDILSVEDNLNLDYNKNEGDINDKRRNISSMGKDGTNVGRGMGNIQTNEGVSNILQTNNERVNRNQEGTTIEQGYGTTNERREYFERVKNNSPKESTNEQIELQNEIKELGIDLKYFVGENDGTILGTTDNDIIYLDVNENNLINEDSNLRQRFYHELFHNIKRNKNLNFETEINELKQYVAENNDEAINKYIENRGYDSSLFSNSKKMKLRLAEEVLSDYSAKYLAQYNIDYNLSQEVEYRLNTLLDDAITTMKLNKKNSYSQLKGDTLPKASDVQDTGNVENITKLPKAKRDIPQDPTKESSYDNNENKIAELLDKRPASQKTTLKDSAYKTIRSFVDKGEAISRLAKKTGNNQLYAKYDHIGTAEAEGQYAISVAQTDNNGNKIGKSIIEIWQPVEHEGLVEEFSNYLLHKHNISRWNQGKPVFGQEITSNISQKFVEDSEKQYPQFKEWSKDINTYNKNQMQNMVDAGLTSKESQEYLNNTYDNYIRIYRDIKGTSPVTQFKGNLKINVPIKKAKGGNQDILPLKDSMAQQTIEIKKAIRRNEFGLELLNVLDNGENVDYDGKQTIVKNDDGTYSFTIFKDGKPVKMEIDEGIYEALTPNKKYEVEKTLPLKTIQKVSQIQRSLLTDKNPLFIATNFFKDIGDAPFNSKYSSKFLKNYVVAANEIKNNGELWNKYRALGGEQNTYFDYEKGIKMPTNSKTGKFVNKIQNLNHIIEQLPRFTEFISTLEAGGTEAQAMYNAAEITTNFKRGGDFAKALNRNGANFLNASIQGFDKQIRNFTNQNGVKGYVNLLAKATILGVLPSILNHLLLDDDEEYQDLPDYIKDSYYLFKTGNGNFIRIPKGRVVSTFGMATRRTLEYSTGEKEAYNGMLNQVLNQVAPNNPLEDNIFAPFISIKNNRSWNGSQIVPQRLQNELPENQYDEKTDSISKTIGKIFKISPKKVNYILDQYTGGIGDIVLPMLTPEANENPISAKFTTNSTMNNKNVSDFYDTKDKLTKQSNSINASDEDILKSKYMNSINSQMNELYKQKREIQNSNLGNSEKLKQVKKIQQQINDIAKFALQDYENIYIDNNYSVIGNIEFYRNSNGEWTKINSLQNTKQNEISNKYDITPSEYYENREEYNYAYQYPQKYSLITNITTYDKYNEYTNKVSQIKDKYSNSTQRKQMIFEYINSLPYNKTQKIILFNMLGNYGISDYKNDVHSYINGLDISKSEKEQMWKQIYGK